MSENRPPNGQQTPSTSKLTKEADGSVVKNSTTAASSSVVTTTTTTSSIRAPIILALAKASTLIRNPLFVLNKQPRPVLASNSSPLKAMMPFRLIPISTLRPPPPPPRRRTVLEEILEEYPELRPQRPTADVLRDPQFPYPMFIPHIPPCFGSVPAIPWIPPGQQTPIMVNAGMAPAFILNPKLAEAVPTAAKKRPQSSAQMSPPPAPVKKQCGEDGGRFPFGKSSTNIEVKNEDEDEDIEMAEDEDAEEEEEEEEFPEEEADTATIIGAIVGVYRRLLVEQQDSENSVKDKADDPKWIFNRIATASRSQLEGFARRIGLILGKQPKIRSYQELVQAGQWMEVLILRICWYSLNKSGESNTTDPLTFFFDPQCTIPIRLRESGETAANTKLLAELGRFTQMLARLELDDVELSLASAWLLFGENSFQLEEDDEDPQMLQDNQTIRKSIQDVLHNLLFEYQREKATVVGPVSRFQTMNVLMTLTELTGIVACFYL